MKKLWSPNWKSSVQPRKQRKYIAMAPLHAKHNLASAHLSKELRKEFGKRSLPLHKGDEVKIMRGSKYGIKAKIAKVDLSRGIVHLEGQLRDKVSGRKVPIQFKPSKLLITAAKLDDKYRARIVERAKKAKQVK